MTTKTDIQNWPEVLQTALFSLELLLLLYSFLMVKIIQKLFLINYIFLDTVLRFRAMMTGTKYIFINTSYYQLYARHRTEVYRCSPKQLSRKYF